VSGLIQVVRCVFGIEKRPAVTYSVELLGFAWHDDGQIARGGVAPAEWYLGFNCHGSFFDVRVCPGLMVEMDHSTARWTLSTSHSDAGADGGCSKTIPPRPPRAPTTGNTITITPWVQARNLVIPLGSQVTSSTDDSVAHEMYSEPARNNDCPEFDSVDACPGTTRQTRT